MSNPPSPAIFFDRDDTLIHCTELPPAPPPAKPGDHVHPHLVELLPGAIDACIALKTAGFKLIVVSNQGAVARGAASLSLVEEIHDRMRAMLTPPGQRLSLIDAVYYCPFHPDGLVPRFTREHPWRKPAPGMLEAAAAELNIDLLSSWLVGDAPRDVEAGRAAGLVWWRCLLLRPGTPTPDLATAARVILAGREPWTITLHANNSPLADPSTRDTVIAAAEALAERAAIQIYETTTTAESFTATLAADEATAVGFAAELRRTTNAWFASKHNGTPLWVSPDA